MNETMTNPRVEPPTSKVGQKPFLEDGYLHANDRQAMTMLRLTHTPAEHRLYQVLLTEVVAAKTRLCAFSVRRLMSLTQLPNYSSIRRSLRGLINKLSIEHHKVACDSTLPRNATVYLIFSPGEILARRAAADGLAYSKEVRVYTEKSTFGQVIEQITERANLSRREAQVAMCCAEGLTNNEIGQRLHISEQTVKFHLRHIFVKCGLKRRTELIAQLLSHESRPGRPQRE
jgi:DNA-binding CsgD family transcriptional regulator